ncbi:MAG: hypothetical protein ACOCUO_03265, partial [archaeon]
MLELVYLALFGTAAYAAKLAVIDRQAEVLTSAIAMILFAMLTFSSFAVRPAYDPGTTVTMEPMVWLSAGASMFSFVIVILAATQRLPTVNTPTDT